MRPECIDPYGSAALGTHVLRAEFVFNLIDGVDVVAHYGDKCGERPVMGTNAQTVVWTDITGQRFYRYLCP
jgi:hypothetical protein